LPLPGVAERERAHRRAVERSVGGDHPVAESRADRRDSLASGPRQLVRDLVGVDHVDAEPSEQIRHRALAAADPARESDGVGLNINMLNSCRLSCGPKNRPTMPAMARYGPK